MFELLNSGPPKDAKISVLYLAAELPTLPAVPGSTLLVIDASSQHFTKWKCSSGDSAPGHSGRQPPDRVAYTQQNIIEATQDSDMLLVVTSAPNPHQSPLLEWLQKLPKYAKPGLSILVTWPAGQTTDKALPVQEFDTHIGTNNPQHALKAVRAIVEIITNSFMIGVDVNDVKAILKDNQPSSAQIGVATAKGTNRAARATQEALASLEGFTADSDFIVAIFAGLDLELAEFSKVNKLIEARPVHGNSITLVGCILENSTCPPDEISIVIIARRSNTPCSTIKQFQH